VDAVHPAPAYSNAWAAIISSITDPPSIARYLELALRFGRLAPGQDESYAGPPELLARVLREPAPNARELVAQTRGLHA
jgi:hypothetical protein